MQYANCQLSIYNINVCTYRHTYRKTGMQIDRELVHHILHNINIKYNNNICVYSVYKLRLTCIMMLIYHDSFEFTVKRYT